jgi:hypothetical protein
MTDVGVPGELPIILQLANLVPELIPHVWSLKKMRGSGVITGYNDSEYYRVQSKYLFLHRAAWGANFTNSDQWDAFQTMIGGVIDLLADRTKIRTGLPLRERL